MKTRRELVVVTLWSLFLGGATAQMTLTTSFAHNNGCSAIYFDLEATGGADVEVTALDINTRASGNVEVWWRPGSFVPGVGSPGGWTQATLVAVTAQGDSNPTPVPLSSPFTVLAGQTVGVYVTTAGTGGGAQINYITGTGGAAAVGVGGGVVHASDAFLSVYQGAGECDYFGPGGNRPRLFSGRITYLPGCQGECRSPIRLSPTVQGVPSVRTSDDTWSIDTTVCGVDQVTPSCGPGGEDTFVQFTAPFDGTARADTCGMGTTFDTILLAMEGGCGSLVELACSDDAPACGTTSSEVQFNVLAGQDYFLVIDGSRAATGLAELRLQLTEIPTAYVPCTTLEPNTIASAAPRSLALEVLQLPASGSGGGQVAWQPCYGQYIAASPGFGGIYEVFDSAGAPLRASAVSLDGRSIHFNPLVGTVDVVTRDSQAGGMATTGLFTLDLSGSAYPTGTGTQRLPTLPGLAGKDTAPAFDYDRNLLYSRQDSDVVHIVDELGMLRGMITLDTAAAGSPNLVPFGLAYTGVLGNELVVGSADAAHVFDLNGSFRGSVPFGVTVEPGDVSGSFVNDLFWIWDDGVRRWRGFDLFDTNFSIACSTGAGGNLTLAPGMHTIDTDLGRIDGMVSPGYAGGAFNFDDIDIAPGADVVVTGTRPLILHATGNITMDGILHAAGEDGDPSPGCNGLGGAGGAGGPGGSDGGEGGGNLRLDGLAGSGPGGGRPGLLDSSGGGGGGFGVDGLPGTSTSTTGGTAGAGGMAYSFILPGVLGGSGGGGGSGDDDGTIGVPEPGDDGGGGGGGGGGAVVLNARGTVSVGGLIDCSGGDGGTSGCPNNSGDGGGGSGGYIAILAGAGPPAITGVLDVSGGFTGTSPIPGGDGAPGRIFMTASPCSFECTATGPTGASSSIVTIEVDAMTMARSYDATFEYSTDRGISFDTCTAALEPMGAPPLVPNPAMGLSVGMTTSFRWDSAADGVSYPATGLIVRVSASDGMAATSCETATFDVGCECGDCNVLGDGVTILDGLAAAQLAVGLLASSGPEQDLCCDVDGTGATDILDALRMAQAAAALPFLPLCP